jgi:hypothetical protein
MSLWEPREIAAVVRSGRSEVAILVDSREYGTRTRARAFNVSCWLAKENMDGLDWRLIAIGT